MDIREYGGGSGGRVALIGEWDPTSSTHERLFRTEVSTAALSGRSVVVVTLSPSPVSYVLGARARPPFDDVAARLHFQKDFGVQAMVTVALSERESRRSGAADLLHELCSRFPIEELVLGGRQTLGVGGLGDAEAVRAACDTYAVNLRRLEPLVDRYPTNDARRFLVRGCLGEAVELVGRHLFWARPPAGIVRVAWPAGTYRAVPAVAPTLHSEPVGDDLRVELQAADGTSCFAWPDEFVPWLGFFAGPADPLR